MKAYGKKHVPGPLRRERGLAGVEIIEYGQRKWSCGFGCMGCGLNFTNLTSAERASESGCPKCGASDVGKIADVQVRHVSPQDLIRHRAQLDFARDC